MAEPRDPETRAGRALLALIDREYGYTPAAGSWSNAIRAVEQEAAAQGAIKMTDEVLAHVRQEARAALLAELRERVAALPDLHHDRQEMCIDRAAVLALLASQDAPASVTDGGDQG